MRPFAEPPPQPELTIGPQDRELFAAHVRRGCKAEAAWAVGPEIERMARQGRLTPDLWMKHAVGAPVGPEALLAATKEALAEVKAAR